MMTNLSPAARAFDELALEFDARFTPWQSVVAQRRAVRAALLHALPPRGKILELGGGTGLDAAFLAEHGFTVTLTDLSPTMVSIARERLIPFRGSAKVVDAARLDDFAEQHLHAGLGQFDGAFSNFAPLNCVADLTQTARGLAYLLKPGAAAMLVVFGTFCPGEMATEVIRRRPKSALRRLRRSPVHARLAKNEFTVVYHRASAMRRTFAPWFKLEARYGIGIAVPPSAAEPWISHRPRLLAAMEKFDRMFSRSLAMLGDHILYQFRRNDIDVCRHVPAQAKGDDFKS